MPTQPQQTPLISKPTPIVLDEMLVETRESNQALYDRQLEYGHLYPDQSRFPGYKFINVKPNSYGQMQYIWGNGFTAQDSYNISKDLSGDANGYPIFSRSYRVLRSDYLVTGPSTKGLPFTGIVAISVTSGGSAYTDDFAVTFSGGSGSDAAATAIVSNGAVVRVEMTSVGTGYTAAPTIGFGAGAGTGAASTAIIQPAAAVLVAEKHGKLPDDDPYTSLYDRVTLIYETLPGPWLPFTRWDIWLGAIQGKRRAVLAAAGQVATLSATSKTTYSAREGSAIVSLQIQEDNTNGSGDSNNPAFPPFNQSVYEDERGVVSTVSQLVVAAGQTASIGETGGVYTHIDYVSYPENQYLLKKVTETFADPGPTLPDKEVNEDGNVTTITRTIKLSSAITAGEVISGTWKITSSKAINLLLSWEIIKSRSLPGNSITGTELDLDGAVVSVSRTMKSLDTIVTQETITAGTSGTWSKTVANPVTELVGWEEIRTRTFPSAVPIVKVYPDDEDGKPVTETRTFVRLVDVTASEAISAGTWSKTSSDPVGDLAGWKVVISRSVIGNVLAGYSQSPDAQGADTVHTSQLLDSTTSPWGSDMRTLAYRDVPVGQKRIRRVLETLNDSTFPVLYDYYRNSLKNNQLITKSYQVVDASTSLPSDSAGIMHEIRHIDKYRSLLIETTYSTPGALSEYRFGAYTMPGLFDEGSYFWSDVCGAFAQYRPEQSMMTQMTTVTEWFSSLPSRQSCFAFLPKSLQLGRGWQMSQRILCDGGTFTYTGSCTESYGVGSSSPSYTGYISSYQGNDEIVAEEVVKDEGNLWKRTTLVVNMK